MVELPLSRARDIDNNVSTMNSSFVVHHYTGRPSQPEVDMAIVYAYLLTSPMRFYALS
jgi:hypothetical protein